MPLEIHVLYVLVRVISANVQNCNKYLIHPFPAILGAAHAGDLVVILEIKLEEKDNKNEIWLSLDHPVLLTL